jgi:microcystin-dependent protein
VSQPFVGEIRMFGGNFNPAGWMLCQGQLLPISEYDTLFTLIGTTYGGDGVSTFALPDLQGRVPVHQGTGFVIGEKLGVESVTLTINQIPAHNHPVQAASGTQGAVAVPAANTILGDEVLNPVQNPTPFAYLPGSGAVTPALTPLAQISIGPTGGNEPHDNMQPFLTINFIISLFGIFPTQN